MSEGSAVVGPDGLARTPWALGDPLLMSYYDTEWGVPVYEENALFERICLEAFQAGLSWLTVLRKREAFQKQFCDFDVDQCSELSDDQLEKALLNPAIIRNRAKVFAVRTNAMATRMLREQEGLAKLIWSFKPTTSLAPRTQSEVPTQSKESLAMAKALKGRGFVFVGPTTAFALMEAIGMVDTHIVGSYRRGLVSGIQRK